MLEPDAQPTHSTPALTVTVTLLFERPTVADIRHLAQILVDFGAADSLASEPHYAEYDDREPDGIMFAIPVVADL